MLDLHLFQNPRFSVVLRRHHARVLRHVRDVLHARPVPAGRPRLLAARRRGAPAADLVRDDGRGAADPEARRPASGPTRSARSGSASSRSGSAGVAFFQVDTPYIQLVITMCVLAAGMAMTMTPMTTQLMAAVPRDRAGMGSATNDTTRELGGALGVAVLGSLLASQYTAGMSDAVAGLPAELQDVAESSIGGALGLERSRDSCRDCVVDVGPERVRRRAHARRGDRRRAGVRSRCSPSSATCRRTRTTSRSRARPSRSPVAGD